MLVLGDEARDNGLATSLLERMIRHYGNMGTVARQHVANLVTNYRCHASILKLPEALFYKVPLPCNSASKTHPDAAYPYLFVCSGVREGKVPGERSTSRKEAEIVMRQVKRFTEPWPTREWGNKSLQKVCVMSSSRSQVCLLVCFGAVLIIIPHCVCVCVCACVSCTQLTATNQIDRKLRDVQRCPTYDLQGQ